MSKQLYRFIKDVRLPSLEMVGRETGDILSDCHVVEGCYSFVWPNGAPCLLAEMYLFDKSNDVKVNKKDGGTLGNYAKSLSHLVRFCYKNKLDFWDLTHNDIDELIYNLCADTDVYNERVRNNDTVIRIIQNCVDFLEWMQDKVATDKRIVGINTRNNRYQIKLKKRGS